jgi:hypothetical protein
MRDRLARELFKLGAKFFQQFPSIDSFQLAQLCEAGRHCERISGECSCLVNRTVGRKLIHNFGAPAKRADRQSAADDFSKSGQIGFDPVNLLGAPARYAKTRYHFVENQKRAMPCAFLAQNR